MKAITLWRPWPWAIFHAGKRVENRSWKPPASIIGEYIAIHAGKRWDGYAFRRMRSGEYGPDAVKVPENAVHPPGIIGLARVDGYFEAAPDLWGHPFVAGPICWKLSDVTQLRNPHPTPMTSGAASSAMAPSPSE